MSPRPPGLERRIRLDLEAKIRSGAWRPGDRVPTEAELMAVYGCARMTVHKALTALAAAGLVVRNKRAGTVVARPHLQTAVLEIPDIAEIVARRGEAYRFQLIQRTVRLLDGADADEAELGRPGEAILLLEGAHFAAEEPFALEQRLIRLAAAPDAETEDFSTTSPGSWLLQHVAWSDARHRIRAVAASPLEARRLGLARGAPLLAVDRWTWRSGEGITFVRQRFRGDRYDLFADFSAATSH
ncbi:MAG: UTRA domain-containing protein [Pseudomonadota bacterium]